MTPEELKGYIGKDGAGNEYWECPIRPDGKDNRYWKGDFHDETAGYGVATVVYTCIMRRGCSGIGFTKEEARINAWEKYHSMHPNFV